MKRFQIILIIVSLIILGFAMQSWGALNNYRELNELSIISSIGIDKQDNGDYSISVQVMNTKKGKNESEGDEGGSEVVVYKQSAGTISLALQNMIKESPKKLYTAHMKLLVINEKLAREEGISIILDYFFRDVQSNKEFVTLIARDTSAEDVLKTLSPIEINPAKDLVDSYGTMLLYQGNTANSVASNLLELYLEPGISVVCASVVVKDDKAEISDIAYFKDEKLKGYLDWFNNVAYNFLQDNISNTVVELSYEGDSLAFEVFKSSTKYNITEENGIFTINFNIQTRGNVIEMENVEINKTSGDISKMQADISSQLKEKLERYVNNTKYTYDTDIMGIEMLVRKFQNKAYSKVKDKFDFRDVRVNISVKTEIANEGGLLKKW